MHNSEQPFSSNSISDLLHIHFLINSVIFLALSDVARPTKLSKPKYFYILKAIQSRWNWLCGNLGWDLPMDIEVVLRITYINKNHAISHKDDNLTDQKAKAFLYTSYYLFIIAVYISNLAYGNWCLSSCLLVQIHRIVGATLTFCKFLWLSLCL